MEIYVFQSPESSKYVLFCYIFAFETIFVNFLVDFLFLFCNYVCGNLFLFCGWFCVTFCSAFCYFLYFFCGNFCGFFCGKLYFFCGNFCGKFRGKRPTPVWRGRGGPMVGTKKGPHWVSRKLPARASPTYPPSTTQKGGEEGNKRTTTQPASEINPNREKLAVPAPSHPKHRDFCSNEGPSY